LLARLRRVASEGEGEARSGCGGWLSYLDSPILGDGKGERRDEELWGRSLLYECGLVVEMDDGVVVLR